MSQPALEKEVGVGGFGYPAMIAINSRKMKFATHKGSFGKDSLNEFYRFVSKYILYNFTNLYY